MANINIGGRLHSTATGNTVAGANEILDDSKGKKQSVINQETDTALAGKQATLVSGTNIKTINNESILGSGNITAGDPNAVKYTEQSLTDSQKTQARTNVGAGTYTKPTSGIPKTDLASGVQGSLDLADSALQYTPSGEIDPEITPADYATQEELSQLEAKVHNLSGKYYGLFADDSELPEGDANGYAFVGTETPFAIWNFDGEDWTDSGAEATSIYGEPGADGVGFQTITSLQDGTMVITLTTGDTITIDLNHNHPQYLKYVMLNSESEMPANPDSTTLYMWPEE